MSQKDPSLSVTSLLGNSSSFPPPPGYRLPQGIKSNADFQRQYHESIDGKTFEQFWLKKALELLTWDRLPSVALRVESPNHYRWFDDGKLNVCVNCIDRHLPAKADKMAIVWEGEPGDKQFYTYAQLSEEVNAICYALKALGLKAGDAITIYMPLCPQLCIAMLACARMGILHNVVFGGFSAQALRDRFIDSKSKMVITANAGFRRGQAISYQDIVWEALQDVQPSPAVVVYQRDPERKSLGTHDWHTMIRAYRGVVFEPSYFEAEHPLFCLYTSGSTGKPKGLMHTSAGYLLEAALSSRILFDWQPNEVHWCTADIGWITGHSYVLYGPLANGATTFIYEGAPDFPDWNRFWQLIANYQVSVFYTAPTAIRALRKHGADGLKNYDLSSLRLLGSVGEPISPDTWKWFYEDVGKKRCPLIDTWWQTETGSIMLSAVPSLHASKPGSAAKPLFGVEPVIVDEQGKAVPDNVGGSLVLAKPWPSMARSILGDHDRYVQQYWSKFPGYYLTGDAARRDEDGYYWILGRNDDVINVAGHRLSTMELEAALCSHPLVAEAAVVTREDSIKGEAVVAFVVLKSKVGDGQESAVEEELKAHVSHEIGSIARPSDLHFRASLPKTRSGKILRRLLRDEANGRPFQGDLSTLEG